MAWRRTGLGHDFQTGSPANCQFWPGTGMVRVGVLPADGIGAAKPFDHHARVCLSVAQIQFSRMS
jgi:hypothetical protein